MFKEPKTDAEIILFCETLCLCVIIFFALICIFKLNYTKISVKL